MLTDFGKVCRMIRLEANDNLGDMAERIGVSSSFLSAVENGKKGIPAKMCEAIRSEYLLDNDTYAQLCEAAESSKTQVKIQMGRLGTKDKDLVISFARKFESLEDEEKEKIMTILRG